MFFDLTSKDYFFYKILKKNLPKNLLLNVREFLCQSQIFFPIFFLRTFHLQFVVAVHFQKYFSLWLSFFFKVQFFFNLFVFSVNTTRLKKDVLLQSGGFLEHLKKNIFPVSERNFDFQENE